MSWWFYLLAATPAVIWGFSPIISKRALSEGGNHIQASFILVVVCGLIYWGVLLTTQPPAVLFSNFSPGLIGIFIFGGVVGTACGRLAAFTGVDKVGASMANVAISTRPFFSGALAIGLLGESITPDTGLGIIFVVIGLIILSRARGGDKSGWKKTDLIYPLIAAIAFGVGNVIRRWGLTQYQATALEAVALNEVGAFVVMGGYLFFTKRKVLEGVDFKNSGLFVIHGCLTATALFAMFEALRLGPVVLVDPLSSLAPLFTAFFSYLFLKDLERVTKGIVGGAILVVIGVILITL
ncbi:MAG: DMT family transporter [bacterium]